MRTISVIRDEQYTKWKYIGPGKRGSLLGKGASLSYSPNSGKNPVSVSVGAGVSIAGGVASGSLSATVSVPLGSATTGKASINCEPVKKKGYYGLQVRKRIKPHLIYSQYRHRINGKWVRKKAKLAIKEYSVIHYEYKYKKFDR